MKLYIILALCSVATAVPLTWDESVGKEFNEFKLKYGKKYSSKQEEDYRMRVYASNRQRIANHNSEAEMGLHSYTLGMNEFGDLPHDEFFQMMSCLQNVSATPLAPATEVTSLNIKDIPESIDWRDKGYVTPVKNQGQCGSCWAFSAAAALEGLHFRKTGQLVSLSEQNLVDCSWAQGNNGCGGGVQAYAFQYVIDKKGIESEESYPYEAKNAECRFSLDKVAATATGYNGIPRYSEEELTKAIAAAGPVSVDINTNNSKFQFYKSGVFYVENCDPEQLTHAVLAVGYGTETNGNDYYIVKNSWGGSWGNNGYILMSRNKSNNCGIATQAVYPTL